MRRLVLLALLGACGGGSDPTAGDLYGDWHADADGTARTFHFAAADDGHAELAGVADVYVLSSYPSGTPPAETQWGHFEVGPRTLTGVGEVLTLATTILGGSGSNGETYGNQILDWSGDAFTIASTTASSGQLTFTRE
jgi:hypothetical protein